MIFSVYTNANLASQTHKKRFFILQITDGTFFFDEICLEMQSAMVWGVLKGSNAHNLNHRMDLKCRRTPRETK
jgi:hypothetical protein